MKFINKNSVSISVRHGDLKNGYYWTSVYPNQEIELTEREGLFYGFTPVKEDKIIEKPVALTSSISNKTVETKHEIVKSKEEPSKKVKLSKK